MKHRACFLVIYSHFRELLLCVLGTCIKSIWCIWGNDAGLYHALPYWIFTVQEYSNFKWKMLFRRRSRAWFVSLFCMYSVVLFEILH